MIRVKSEYDMLNQQNKQKREWEDTLCRSSDMAKQKEEDVHDLERMLACTEQGLRQAVSERDEKIRTLKLQRRLLKDECLTLRSQLKTAELDSEEQAKMFQVEKETLRLRHERELEVSRKPPAPMLGEEHSLAQNQDPDQQGVNLEKKEPAGPPPRVGLGNFKFLRYKNKRAEKSLASNLLNANAEISLLKTQLEKTLNQNNMLKKSLAAEQTCVQDLSLKMHDLLVQMEQSQMTHSVKVAKTLRSTSHDGGAN